MRFDNYCRNCGGEVTKLNYKYCWYCGKEIEEYDLNIWGKYSKGKEEIEK